MKGFEPLVAATLLIAVALMLAIIIYQWQITYIHNSASDIENSANKKLICDRADISFLNASYNCASSCASDVQHTLDVKLKNYGDVGLSIEKIYLRNTSGSLIEYPGGLLDIGEVKSFKNVSTSTCQGINKSLEEILVVTDCPNVFVTIPADKINWINC